LLSPSWTLKKLGFLDVCQSTGSPESRALQKASGEGSFRTIGGPPVNDEQRVDAGSRYPLTSPAGLNALEAVDPQVKAHPPPPKGSGKVRKVDPAESTVRVQAGRMCGRKTFTKVPGQKKRNLKPGEKKKRGPRTKNQKEITSFTPLRWLATKKV